MENLISQQIGRYVLQSQLSQKAGRQTFLARDIETNGLVIVKVLQLNNALGWDELELFEREAQILQHLEHSTVPQYKESFETEINGVHSFVLVQTYIAAPSARTVVEAGKLFSEAETITIAQQLLETLSYLHTQLPPVVHRDIKPSNILISEPFPSAASSAAVIKGVVYLVDFGAVQIAASRSSGTITIVGSYGYMPLEQFIGQTTPASDLYSLGMTLLYLLTGVHPSELPRANGYVQIERISERLRLSDWFTRWLTQMIAPYTDQRFESAVIALAALNGKDGSFRYSTHLRPSRSHLSIRRQKDELRILCTSSPRFNSQIFNAGFKGDMQEILGLLVHIPKVFFLVGILSIPIVFLLGPFFPILLNFAGYLLIIMVVSMTSVNLFGIFVLPFRRLFRSNSQRATREYQVISISRTRGIRMGTATGYSPNNISSTKWTVVSSPFRSIKLLTYNPGYTFDRHYQKREIHSSPNNICIPAKLSIYAGKREYLIQCEALCEAEQLWLNEELNNFLGLSLKRLAPTVTGKAAEV